jgi:uncharacterized protein YoaH (UPF0181 family)
MADGLTPEDLELIKRAAENNADALRQVGDRFGKNMDRAGNSAGQFANKLQRSGEEAARAQSQNSNILTKSYNEFVRLLNRTANAQKQPIEVGTDALITAMNIATEGVGSFSSALLKKFPGGEKLKGVTETLEKALGRLGAVTMAGVNIAAIGAKDSIDLLTTQLVENYKAFKQITQSGIVLGSGLEGFATAAAKSGVPLQNFTRGLQLARQDLSSMGVGAGQAIDRVSSVLEEINRPTGELSQQLSALGFQTEEQIQLVAMQLANDRAAGIVRQGGDKAIAAQTVELAKNMRVLSDITGQDAKAAIERARAQSLEADVFAQAMAKGGPEAVERLRSQLETMPDMYKKGFLEMVSTGGTITDVATNIAASMNPQILNMFQRGLTDLSDTTINGVQAQKNMQAELAKVATYARENSQEFQALGTAARVTGDATLVAASAFQNTGLTLSTKMGAGTFESARAAAENLANRTDALTRTTEELARLGTVVQRETQNILFAPLKIFSEGVTEFTRVLASGTQGVRTTLEKFGLNPLRTREAQLGPPPPETGTPPPPAPPVPGTLPPPVVNRPGTRPPPAPTLPSTLPVPQVNNRRLGAPPPPAPTLPLPLPQVEPKETEKKLSEADNQANRKTFEQTAMSDLAWQNEIKGLMKQQVMLLAQHLNVSKDMTGTMSDIQSYQLRQGMV